MGTRPRTLLLGLAMLVAAALASVLKPTQEIARTEPEVRLEDVIPKQMGEWEMLVQLDSLMVNPELRARLDEIYSQTLTRTYADKRGYRIMLSIAYGGNQSDSLQLHRPEACYPAQGFEILAKRSDSLGLGKRELPVKRMLTRQGARVEPLTYWVVIGSTATRGNTDRKLARIKLGLTGRIADGMLVRVSSIDPDDAHAYGMQNAFVLAMANALDEPARVRIFGEADDR